MATIHNGRWGRANPTIKSGTAQCMKAQSAVCLQKTMITNHLHNIIFLHVKCQMTIVLTKMRNDGVAKAWVTLQIFKQEPPRRVWQDWNKHAETLYGSRLFGNACQLFPDDATSPHNAWSGTLDSTETRITCLNSRCWKVVLYFIYATPGRGPKHL